MERKDELILEVKAKKTPRSIQMTAETSNLLKETSREVKVSQDYIVKAGCYYVKEQYKKKLQAQAKKIRTKKQNI
jgi:hypothetical protein